MDGERLYVHGPAEGPVGDPVQADGDIIARLPAEIGIAPRRLRLIVP